VRAAVPEDAGPTAELSREAILRSAAEHYTSGQRQAWASRRTAAAHRRMIEETTAMVAVDGEVVVGFVSVALAPTGALVAGEVDQLFVHPDHGGRGLALLLLTAAETAAREAGLTELVTHASWRAVPVFARAGFEQVAVESVALDAEVLTRARMHKALRYDESR